ncbi:hypothetical protein ACK2M7_12045 [Chryseobacterium sp. TY4]
MIKLLKVSHKKNASLDRFWKKKKKKKKINQPKCVHQKQSHKKKLSNFLESFLISVKN